MKKKALVLQYREAAIEALVLARGKLWKGLSIDDFTPSVMQVMADVEKRMLHIRMALTEPLVADPEVTDDEIARVVSGSVIPHETGRKPLGE